MIGHYIEDAITAIDKGKRWLEGNRRPHVLIGRTSRGYLIIDPRRKEGHYCQIVGKLFRKTSD